MTDTIGQEHAKHVTLPCCVCCGSRNKLEIHHVAGRRFSPVTTVLCRACHVYCSLAMVYERRWLDSDPLIRLWVGLLDILNRFADCNSLSVDGRKELIDGQRQGLWLYRTCSAIADHTYQSSKNSLIAQLSEIHRLVGEIVNYVLQP